MVVGLLLARRIRKLRKERGLTQKEVAEKLGTTLHEYRRLENANRLITLQEVYKLSQVFDVHYREITDINVDLYNQKRFLSILLVEGNPSPDDREKIEEVIRIIDHFAAQERLYRRMAGEN